MLAKLLQTVGQRRILFSSGRRRILYKLRRISIYQGLRWNSSQLTTATVKQIQVRPSFIFPYSFLVIFFINCDVKNATREFLGMCASFILELPTSGAHQAWYFLLYRIDTQHLQFYDGYRVIFEQSCWRKKRQERWMVLLRWLPCCFPTGIIIFYSKYFSITRYIVLYWKSYILQIYNTYILELSPETSCM